MWDDVEWSVMNDGGAVDGGKTIGSLETAFDIVELIAEDPKTTTRELAERLDYSRSTVHYYLKTLEKHRFVAEEEDGYRLGVRFLHYGTHAVRNHPLTGVLDDEVEKLAREAETTALFAVHRQGRSVFVAQSSNGPLDGMEYFGTERYLHATAFGKALLAQLPEETVVTIIERDGLPEVSPGVVTDREALTEELEAIRERGFAYERGDLGEDVCSVAAPIVRNREEETVGAIGIVGRTEDVPDPGSHIKAQRFAENPVTIVKRYTQILRNKTE